MGTARTVWHFAFVQLVNERAPAGIEVRGEVLLTTEPQRADLLLLRRIDAPARAVQAHVLRGLWPLLGEDTLAEFKSISRPFRRGDLVRLLGYGSQYHVTQIERLQRRQLTLALFVPNLTPTLRTELDGMGFTLNELGGGYARMEGPVPYPMVLVRLDEVADVEHDDLLRSFGNRRIMTTESAWWWQRHTNKANNMIEDMEGYEDVAREIAASLSPEVRVAGLTPAQRMAGLSPEEILLELPDELLRSQPEDVLRTLSPEGRERVRRRIGR
jgi:hypothetical protein